MGFEDLTPEQQEKAKACKTSEELEALVAKEGLHLSKDELEGLSGGTGCDGYRRTNCTTKYIKPICTTFSNCKSQLY